MQRVAAFAFLSLAWLIPSRVPAEVKLHVGFRDGVSAMAFSPDGVKVAIADYRNDVLVWDIVTGKLAVELKGHPQPVTRLAWSGDAQTLIAVSTRLGTGARASNVKHWNATTGEERKGFDIKEGGGNLFISGDGDLLVTSGFPEKEANLWDLGARKKITTLGPHFAHVRHAVIFPDGKMAATSDRWRVWLWQLPGGNKLWHFGPEHVRGVDAIDFEVHGLSFSPAENAVVFQNDATSEIIYRDVESGKESRRNLPRSGRFFGFSKDGKFLVTAHHKGEIDLWSTAKLEKLATLTAKGLGAIELITISPDGRFLAAANVAHRVWVWDIPMAK